MEDFIMDPEIHLDSNGLIYLTSEGDERDESIKNGDESFLLSDDEINEDDLKSMCEAQMTLA